MKAVVCREWGKPDRLVVEEFENPVAGPREVIIDVEATGVNFADTLIIQGLYQVRPEHPFVPGMEVAGTVADMGKDVEGLKIGEPVIGIVRLGGFAEKVSCPSVNTLRRPGSISATTAAALPIAYGTAHIGLVDRAGLRSGESLLVHGASGGVGLAAVEIGKALGAKVIATAGSSEKLAVARDHGADYLIDYSQREFRHTVKEITGGGADVIFDPVGGDIFDQSLRCVAWEGRILTVGYASGRIPKAPANILLVKNISVVGVHWSNYNDRKPELVRQSFEEIFGWIEEGCLNPLVSQVYDLEETPQALDDLLSRRARGKIVVTP